MSRTPNATVERAIADAHRREWAFVLAATVRVARDLDLAEDCVQDAYATALDAWARDGVPERPGAWLTTTARRKALDALRRGQTLRSKLPLLVETDEPREADMDDPSDSARGPVPDDRLDAVLTVIHLLYTTGHTAPSGERLVRGDLVERALDLARMLLALMPEEREVKGLLALLLVTDARRSARTDAQGRLLVLEDQDRSAWDRAAIEEGHRLVVEALKGGNPGRFALQAAIAALHAAAPNYAETDWPQILALYDELLRIWPSPVVALNRAVAVAMVRGPEPALAEVEALERGGRLSGYRYLPATKADLLRRLGRHAEAVLAYRAALDLTDNGVERRFLSSRLAGSSGR